MLTKLKIVAYDGPPGNKLSWDSLPTEASLLAMSKLGEFVAYFNPESLRIQVGRATKKTPALKGAESQEPLGTDATTYSFNLVIDGTGVSGPKIDSVKAEVDKFIAFTQIGIERAGLRPIPFLDLIWGDFYVQCQLDSVSINYTLFDSSGRPLRATLDCSFTEVVSPGAVEASSVETAFALQGGDSLQALAGKNVGGFSQLVTMARKNGVDSIRGARAASTNLF